ncbi:hypothetical protein Mtc_1086 [Methanocella conradii HZ254]|uniref:UPF0215 protein Mtc_1086 n=1 Tax=Methanocella conradii (strain DSM 24694 / JCM 17849 / CGMCC 1.5162 / HZ254) TaxID=1041930 RepID=H8I712_METCZ|nr:DUF99 family protein [Methanocella conradii]AFC99842.1 hypothetical protein Mtc_1086 [Methanocella conradii HZ254]MDI6896441.1 DUF99 family protein [Methanocella conradii]
MERNTGARRTHIKQEIRILGIDDSPLISEDILVVGAVMRGGEWLEGVLRTYIKKDGLDATGKLVDMVRSSKHFGQIRVAMLNGVTMGGFNAVDMEALYESTGIPVISVMRKPPDMASIKSALKNLSEPEHRFEVISRAGNAIEVPAKRGKPIYMQYKGLDADSALNIVRSSTTHSRVPEPLRVAHLIATGIVLGESSPRP